DLFFLVCLYDIPYVYITIVLYRQSAFHTGSHFLDVIFKALERLQLGGGSFPDGIDHDAIAYQPDLGIPEDLSFQDETAGHGLFVELEDLGYYHSVHDCRLEL